jgi:hypothetical protein
MLGAFPYYLQSQCKMLPWVEYHRTWQMWSWCAVSCSFQPMALVCEEGAVRSFECLETPFRFLVYCFLYVLCPDIPTAVGLSIQVSCFTVATLAGLRPRVHRSHRGQRTETRGHCKSMPRTGVFGKPVDMAVIRLCKGTRSHSQSNYLLSFANS